MAKSLDAERGGDARAQLFELGVAALKQQGWTVQRAGGSRKPSVRIVTKRGKSLTVTIRTSQDHWLAFPLKDADGTRFGPLATADRVVVVTPDPDDAAYALVYDFPADEIRKRFNDAFAARKKAGFAVTQGHGMWVSLFRSEGQGHPVYTVGGGVAAKYKPTRMPIAAAKQASALADVVAAAKREIGAAAGVDPSQVRISIEA